MAGKNPFLVANGGQIHACIPAKKQGAEVCEAASGLCVEKIKPRCGQ
jgi:hypothetical protein